jgi:hypothetical protein
MAKNDRSRRDVHALDEHGNLLCNPRDKEAAHRAEMGDIAIGEGREVTCQKCLSRQLRLPIATKDQASENQERLPAILRTIADDIPKETNEVSDRSAETANRPVPFVRIRGLVSMAADYGPGDGIDPKQEQRQKVHRQRKHKPNYANQRLANQIFDALCLSSLLSEMGLDEFSVSAVRPNGPNGLFLVEIQCRNPNLPVDPGQIEQRLKAASGQFRCEVTRFLHRKKAPGLKFRVLPSTSSP